MSEMAKAARAAMKQKAKRLTTDPHKKVDASSWEPEEPMNTGAKTGLRPISPRAYKRGGKVGMNAGGSASAPNAGRKARKDGGKISDLINAKVNRNVKEANASEFGRPHIGGLNKGGRTGKMDGGSMNAPVGDPRLGIVPRARLNMTNQPNPYKRGGKACGGYQEGGTVAADFARIQKMIADRKAEQTENALEGVRRGNMSSRPLDRLPPTGEYNGGRDIVSPQPRMGRKAGGKVDEAQDKKLVKKAFRQHENAEHGGKHSELKLKKGGTAKKARGGNLGHYDDAENRPSLRLVKTHTGPEGHKAKVYKDGDYNEHRVKFFKPDGSYQSKADYHSDLEDANSTAAHEVAKGFKGGGKAKKAGGGSMSPDEFEAARRVMRVSRKKPDPVDDELFDKGARAKFMQQKYNEFRSSKDKDDMPMGRASGGKAGNYTGGTRPTGGRVAKAGGGLLNAMNDDAPKSKKSGKTNINIIINPHKMDTQAPGAPMPPPPRPMPPPMPPMPPQGGMPPGGPPPGIGGPPPGMGGPPPGMLPMPRKSGGKVGHRSYSSYKDMDAGAGSGFGRLEKTEIAKKKYVKPV